MPITPPLPTQLPERPPGPTWLWRGLIDPSAAITDRSLWRHMRTVAALSIPLLAFSMMEVALTPAAGRLPSLAATGLIAIAYGLSRTRYTALPAPMLTVATLLVPYYGLLTAAPTTSPLSELAWSIAMPVVAALVLPLRVVFPLGLAHLVFFTVAVFLNPQVPTTAAANASGIVSFFVAVTVMATAILEDESQERRRGAAALHRVAEQMAKANALSEGTLDAMGDGLLLVDPDRSIRRVNPALCTALGYRAEDLLGLPLEDVLVNDEDDTAMFVVHDEGRGHQQEVQVPFRTRHGDHARMSCRITHFRVPSMQGFGRVILVRDLRETIRVLEAAAETEAHRAKADELQLAHDRLLNTQAQLIQAGKLTAVGELAGAIAHEVNNPLGAALLAADLVEEALETDPDLPTAHRHLSTIQDAISRCRRIIDGLLDFARQSEGRLEHTDLAEVVEASLALLHKKLQLQGAEVRRAVEGPLPVWADRNQLSQVLVNLLANAGQAVEPTGGVITIGGRRTDRGCEIWVQDTGHGIDPLIAKRIFEPFYTTKPRGQGTGLGLSISYGIVIEHGGTIDVESQIGEGATFRVVLPDVDAPAEVQA